MISMETNNNVRRFRQKILDLGLFQKDQIEELHAPTKESLERKLKKIESKIQQTGKEHNLNTFFMLYYHGPAEL